MAEISTNLAVSIQLTPSEEAVLQPLSQLDLIESVGRSAYEYTIILTPGDPCPLALQIQNKSSCALNLHLDLQFEGYFLQSWCKVLPDRLSLEPGEFTESHVYFSVPDNFLEDPFLYPTGKLQSLDYRANLYAWAELKPINSLVHSISLNFAIRPRSLYLNFLPAFYGDIDFVGRFLSIFEKAFEPSVQILENLWMYLDPLTAPKSLLPFLAHWVAWPVDARWDEHQQRKLIRQAVEIYRWRGTRRGLRLFLHLYTGLSLDDDLPESQKQISIEESFAEGFVLNKSILGQDTLLGGGRPFHFVVKLRSSSAASMNRASICQLIDREKPAFCTYDLYFEDQARL